MLCNSEIKLPCGEILPNRLGKSAMSENMATNFLPGENFYNAYRKWAEGGVGLCITGNVMIDSNHLGEPNNIVMEDPFKDLGSFKKWASANKGYESKIWVQLNHPGKQSPKFLNKAPVAPSSIPLRAPLNKMFMTPKELSEDQIWDIITRFGDSARLVQLSGFNGVQIHGAHGYLVSQFLSPNHNRRSDKWGGSLENRMKFVSEVYQSIRKNVGDSFPIGIKLNSADFTKGGMDHESSIEVARKLSNLGIDLIELSGGSYERPIMMGQSIKESTRSREAYFLEYASAIKKVISCPLMLTGGFRTSKAIIESIENGEVDIVGLGRSLCLNTDLPKEIFSGKAVESEVRPLSTGVKVLDKTFPLEIIWYTMQIHRLGKGLSPQPRASVYKSIFRSILDMGIHQFRKVRF